jgi:hypothetical protein
MKYYTLCFSWLNCPTIITQKHKFEIESISLLSVGISCDIVRKTKDCELNDRIKKNASARSYTSALRTNKREQYILKM